MFLCVPRRRHPSLRGRIATKRRASRQDENRSELNLSLRGSLRVGLFLHPGPIVVMDAALSEGFAS